MSVAYKPIHTYGRETYEASCDDCEWTAHAWGPGPRPHLDDLELRRAINEHVAETGHSVRAKRLHDFTVAPQ